MHLHVTHISHEQDGGDYVGNMACGQVSIKQIGFKLIDMKLVHYSDVIMGAIASQITSLTVVYSTVYSGADIK